MSPLPCPCCGHPLLDGPDDTCPLCFWDAEMPLDAARAQYADHGHALAPDDPLAPRPGALRDRLTALVAGRPFDEAAYRAWRAEWEDRGC